ncbi:hypothetical protein [Paraclostridium bifermentans]|uniref:hypothetical protein n=1 Tax=Paraclostridium bifermentans TaxID=1490 RepID=UPI00359C407C
MSKYNDWKMIDWIIAGVIALTFISIPDWVVEHSSYTIPLVLLSVFLIYCFLSVVYWIIHKKINMVVHYCLIITIYSALISLYIIACNSGV